MLNETTTHNEKIKKFFDNYLLPLFNTHINSQIKFIKDFNELLTTYREKYENSTKHDAQSINNLKLSYYKKSYDLISQKYHKTYKRNFDQDLIEFVSEINSYLNTINENINRVQDEERFLVDNKDSLRIKFFKGIKRFLYNISQFPVKSSNFFRKLFKRPLKEKRIWYHKVPLRNLTTFYLRDTISLGFIPIIEDVNKKISAAFLATWKKDEDLSNLSPLEKKDLDIELKKEIEELERLPGDIAEAFGRIFNQTIILYEDAFRKSGTMELPYRKFSSLKVQKKHKELNEKYESLYKGWINTFYSLFEDWRLNKELYTLSENLRHDFYDLSTETNKKLNKNIFPQLREIEEFLSEIVYKFKDFSGNSSELKSLLYREKDRLHNKLSNKIIYETSDIIFAQNIPDLIDQMEYSINNGIKTLPEKRAIVKTITYNERIKDSEFDYISPREIITYSTIHPYLKVSSQIKNNVMLKLNEIRNAVMDINQIADFNLESALSVFKSDKSSSEDPIDIAIDGVNRAIAKKDEVEKKLNDIELKINKDLFEAIEKINDELIRLTKNENVLEIKLKITRQKTLQRTVELKYKSVFFVKNFFPQTIKWVFQGIAETKKYYQEVTQKFGLAQPVVSISTEISDFLNATENAVLKLPFVYQRLFRIEPLEDERFFEGREKELSLLKSAYENWKLKRYAPVIIYGEKGSGTTTLLNFYFKNLDTDHTIIKTIIDRNIYDERDFIHLLRKIFKNSTFNNIDDVSRYLNDLVTKQIIVIENMQNLFLKKVNGFICLKLLFELISKTNQNVFWIISSNQYAWEYLRKVMNVSDFFGYQVRFEKLSDKQIIEIILKRHRISGYNIYFELPDNTAIKKKYKRLSDEQIQDYLKKEYFSELNEFAKSNISLALLYWMRSAKEVTTDTIKLGSVIELDFSFLKTLNPEKLFILYLLLLHDGLTEEDLIEIYNKPLKDIRLDLLLLQDDGIIIKQENIFNINPLLYRQIVYLLQSRNIIH